MTGCRQSSSWRTRRNLPLCDRWTRWRCDHVQALATASATKGPTCGHTTGVDQTCTVHLEQSNYLPAFALRTVPAAQNVCH